LTGIKAGISSFAYSYPVKNEGSLMSEQIDPELKVLARWLIGGLVVVFIGALIMM
jgi:hypothetical protein